MISFRKKSIKHQEVWALILLIFFILVFFEPLFYPELKTIVTPDFGQSDVFQLNVPLKYFLSENLKNNQLPLWNPYIANGFPALAEGQTGTFFILNLLLFKFLPFPLAFNLGIVSIFITTAIGTYLFCREIKLSRIASFFSAITFTFSGFFIGHLTHFNLIQATSLFPLLLYLTLKIIASLNSYKLLIWGGLFSFVLSQQLFTGFPQMVLITLIFVWILFFIQLVNNKSINNLKKLSLLTFLLICTFLGFLIAGIQLLPQYEFLKISTRSKLAESQTSYYSYPFKHLITLVSPYFLGNPKIGTYPPFYEFDGSVFWENTGYIGLIGIILAGLGLFLKSPYKKFLLISLVGSFLLMTGKYSPLYFIYEIPPFSLFRVPARFILPFIFSLTILAGLCIDKLSQIKFITKKFLVCFIAILIFLQFIDLFKFNWSYHAIASWQDWLSLPETAEFIKSEDTANNSNPKILSLYPYQSWNGVFTTKGWSDIKPYFYFRNNLTANSNVLYNLSQFGVYPVQKTKRYDFFESLMMFGIQNKVNQIDINNTAEKMLRIAGINYIISTQNLNLPSKNQPVFQTSEKNNLPTYRVYSLKPSLGYYFTNNILSASTVEETLNLLTSSNFNPPQNVILEKKFSLLKTQNQKPVEIALLKTNFRENIYQVNTNNEGFLVTAQSYYPGWEALIDENTQEILPANLNFSAIYVPPGNHQITLTYKPKMLKSGLLLSLLGSIIAFLMVIVVPLICFRKAVNNHSFSARC